MKIICLSGLAGSGKDTVAGLLQSHLWGDGYRVLVTHYADLLKHMCRTLFGWDGQKDERGRQLLQHVGTDVIRAQNPDFWVDFVIQELRLFPSQWDFVIIADCRFPNELNRLKEAGFDVVHIQVCRPSHESTLTPEQQQHSSETAMASVQPDYALNNAGTIADLCADVLRMFRSTPLCRFFFESEVSE